MSSVPFQLFKGINYQLASGDLTVFQILNANQTIVALTGDGNQAIIVIGFYNRSRLIAFPKTNLIDTLNKNVHKSNPLVNNFVNYLTRGKCTNFFHCYYPLEKYKYLKGIRNAVIGVSPDSVFNVSEFTNEIIKNDWHLFIGSETWQETENLKPLVKLYGICITTNTERFNLINHNICTNITFSSKFECS